MVVYVYKFELFHDGEEAPFKILYRAFISKNKLSDVAQSLMKEFRADEISCTSRGRYPFIEV